VKDTPRSVKDLIVVKRAGEGTRSHVKEGNVCSAKQLAHTKRVLYVVIEEQRDKESERGKEELPELDPKQGGKDQFRNWCEGL